ncbi:MAG: hypothetical protein J0M15_14870 [Deltaproteobacteria bacterium]|nr:hypothetical protein [Deltaproteobacteria bacterium]
MKKALLIIVTLITAISQASVYSCNISRSSANKAPDVWSFIFDTEKENSKFIDIDIEQQTKAGCVVLRASKVYLSCAYGSEKNSVFSSVEDGTAVFSFVSRNESGFTLLSCVKQ